MAWTYDSSLATNKDRVRFLIGDTDTTDQQLQDGEITWVLTRVGCIEKAAAKCCRALAAKYSRQADSTVGDLAVKKSQRAAAYLELAIQLEQDSPDGAVYVGGVNVSEKQTYEGDTDLLAPKFFRDMQKYPGTTNEEPVTSETSLLYGN